MPIVSEPLGRVLGNRYRLVAALGSGASAHVFLAEDMVLQRRVAVKVLQPTLARDETFLRRFRAEARSVAALNHPHVLRVFDWGEGEDGPYLVVEYLEGGSLYDMFARGRRLSAGQAARIGQQAADGLAYAHARGIVHRDVKPANILFDEDGRVRVSDFGVARALSSTTTTDPGTVLGTVRYVSPEQAQGLQLDGRSDVYSLGLVLYEGMTGSVPFSRETPLATLQARVGEHVPADPRLGRLAPVLAEACAPDEEDRPEAAELAQQLAALAESLASGAPLHLVRRDPVEDAELGSGEVEDLTVDLAVGDPTLAGDGAAAAGLGAVAALGAVASVRPPAGLDAGWHEAAPAVGFTDTGEPTATIRLPDRRAQRAAARQKRQAEPPPPRDRSRRRWPWVVALAVVAAAVLVGGGVYVVKSKVLAASHRVPELEGKTLAKAKLSLRAEDFVAKVGPRVTSTKVPAGEVVSQSPKKGVSLKVGSTVQLVLSSGEPTVRVPTLTGKGFHADCAIATQLLSEAHLKARCPALVAYSKTVPQGDVINWSYQSPGRRPKLYPKHAPYGSTILVAVSKGVPPIKLPSLAGQSYTQAARTLSAYGLVPKELLVYSTTLAPGVVVSTTPGTGATVFPGYSVTLVVSEGPQYGAVPTVIGDTVPAATSAIRAAGYSVSAVYGPGTGVVFTTDPLAGQKEKLGTTVDLYTEKPPKANEPKPKTGSGTTTSTTSGTATTATTSGTSTTSTTSTAGTPTSATGTATTATTTPTTSTRTRSTTSTRTRSTSPATSTTSTTGATATTGAASSTTTPAPTAGTKASGTGAGGA